MDYTFKVVSAKKDTSLADGKKFIDVTFNIVGKDGKKQKAVANRRLAFPFDANKKEIEAELKRYVSVFEGDEKQAAVSAQVEEAEKKADKVIESLVG